MADQKISQLTSITGANVSDATDVLAIVDSSNAETKKITRQELFRGVGELTGDAVQSGVVDSTAGRLLKMGAFGLGSTSAPAVTNNDCNDVTVSGLYTFDSLAVNTPTFTSNGMLLHISRTSTIHSQLAISRATSSLGRIAVRAKDGTSWSDWFELSVDSGTNANGRWTRFGDGTQICTNQAFTTSAAGALTWTYPAAFIYPNSPERPAVSGAISSLISQPTFLTIGGIVSGGGGLTTSVDVGAALYDGTLVSANASLMAIGRWY